MIDMLYKGFHFEVKAASDDGTFEGYGAAYGNLDDGGDICMPGCLTKAIPNFLAKGFIALNHDWRVPVGKPMEASEDGKGFHLKARISDTQQGRDVKTLLKDKVIQGLSIGYDVERSEPHTLESLKSDLGDGFQSVSGKQLEAALAYGRRLHVINPLYEVSPVSVPMNDAATITGVKRACGAMDLPIASRDRAWDASAAEKRIREWAGVDEEPNARYRRGFMWYDPSNADQFGAYKLPFADIIDGKLTCVPRAVFAVAAVLQGSRGGVDLPDADKAAVKKRVSHYYARFRSEFNDDTLKAPWEDEGKSGEELEEPGTEPLLEEHSNKAQAAVMEYATLLPRLQWIIGDRLKAGRVLSDRNRQRIQGHIDMIDRSTTALNSVKVDLAKLLEETAPEKATPEQVERAFSMVAAVQARLRGVPVP